MILKEEPQPEGDVLPWMCQRREFLVLQSMLLISQEAWVHVAFSGSWKQAYRTLYSWGCFRFFAEGKELGMMINGVLEACSVTSRR